MAAQHRVGVVDDAALGDAELLAHEVDPGDLLGHRMLDLEPGVHFEERDRAIGADEELAGPGIRVAGLLEDRLGGGVELIELVLRQEGSRSLFDKLLVTALQ